MAVRHPAGGGGSRCGDERRADRRGTGRGGAATLPSPFRVEELDRKPSSCPFLFTWNGERFEFVTDFLGGGEMGTWLAPGVFNRPDPVEYVRIRGDQLRAATAGSISA